MARTRLANPTEVKVFVVETVEAGHPYLAKRVQERFGVSRQTAHNYISDLVGDGVIVRTGHDRYELAQAEHLLRFEVDGLEEHRVWSEGVLPLLTDLPSNVLEICDYGCTEMVNNVIDHSGSETVQIEVVMSPASTRLNVYDRGVGIFRKIADALDLEDERHAVLELSKGKVTTDPENHTGEGIFFSSRVFDRFAILSGDVYFSHDHDRPEDWIIGEEHRRARSGGTAVFMTMTNRSETVLQDVFDEFTTETEEYRFDRTMVPVKLMRYGDERLVSRSQAKRLMNRFDLFRTVLLDFEGVPSIGQAFADEVFRVFRLQHPEVEILAVNANEQVARMVSRATAASVEPA